MYWTLTAEDLDRIAADLWSGINGPANEVTSVKGKNPKRPPLTYEAKHALSRLVDNVIQINGILDGLTERALKRAGLRSCSLGHLPGRSSLAGDQRGGETAGADPGCAPFRPR